MRNLFVALLLPIALGGCATGYLADRFAGREEILSAQLPRFGLSTQEASCLSGRLARRLTYGKLRQLERRANAVRQGLSNPARLTMNDLTIAANNVGDREVRLEFDSSVKACGIRPGSLAAAAPAEAPSVAATAASTPQSAQALAKTEAGAFFTGELPPPSGAAPAAAAAGAAVLNPLWLNLGAADSGQSIAIDGSSVEREPDARIAWFRMMEANATPSLSWYRLRVDCTARTIEPKERRRVDAEGRELEHQVYPEGYERPAPIERGTVTEIAYLSLCT